MKIIVDDLAGPEIAQFLAEHVEEMKAVTPPGSKHALDLEGLRVPEVTFWSVRDDQVIVACGAIKLLGGLHAEIKSMRVAPNQRQQGVASLLLEHIINESRQLGQSRLLLETGSFPFFEPARRLYLKHGFELCGPFADYNADPNSVFMTKLL